MNKKKICSIIIKIITSHSYLLSIVHLFIHSFVYFSLNFVFFSFCNFESSLGIFHVCVLKSFHIGMLLLLKKKIFPFVFLYLMAEIHHFEIISINGLLRWWWWWFMIYNHFDLSKTNRMNPKQKIWVDPFILNCHHLCCCFSYTKI